MKLIIAIYLAQFFTAASPPVDLCAKEGGKTIVMNRYQVCIDK